MIKKVKKLCHVISDLKEKNCWNVLQKRIGKKNQKEFGIEKAIHAYYILLGFI